MAEGSRRHRKRNYKPGWAGLYGDLSKSASRIFMRSSLNHRRVLLAAMIIGTVLRILRLNGPVTYDEALTYVEYAGRSFSFLFSDYTFTGNHILYSALARASTLIFGVHAWSLRLPALVAGILVLPLGYAFARVVFNRHIALIVLCLLAVSGPFVEYSALARGFSLTWLLMLCGLLAGRYFVKSENLLALAFLAVACALGFWATPDMVYPALLCYLWSALMVLKSYKTTAQRRLLKLAASFLLAIGLCFLCYAPVVIRHSVDHLLHHPSLGEHTWEHFMSTHQDKVFDLWAYFTGTASTLLAFAGTVGVIYAAYTSIKYRLLVFSMVLATVPVVLMQRVVAPPAAWIFSLFFLQLGAVIGLFYLLKLVRDKLMPRFTMAQRTVVACGFVLLVFGWSGIRGEGDPVERYPEAVPAAEWLMANVRPGDRVCAKFPWDLPVVFQVICLKGNQQMFKGLPATKGAVYVLVGPGQGQSPEEVLLDAALQDRMPAKVHLVESWRRLELFSNR